MEFVAFCTIVMLAVGGVTVLLFAWELVSQVVGYWKRKRLERSEGARMLEAERKRKRESRRRVDKAWKDFNRECRERIRAQRKGKRKRKREKKRKRKRKRRESRRVARRNNRFTRRYL